MPFGLFSSIFGRRDEEVSEDSRLQERNRLRVLEENIRRQEQHQQFRETQENINRLYNDLLQSQEQLGRSQYLIPSGEGSGIVFQGGITASNVSQQDQYTMPIVDVSRDQLMRLYCGSIMGGLQSFARGPVSPEKPKRIEPIKFAKEEDYYTWLAGSRE